jgi:hypothetical protein
MTFPAPGPVSDRRERYRLALDVAKVAQTLSLSIDRGRSRAGTGVQDTHHGHLPRLLRHGGERRGQEAACHAAGGRSPTHQRA